MMKKLLSAFVLMFVALAANSCQLAVTEENQSDMIYYPYSVVLEVYDNGLNPSGVDTGMFDWSWLCDESAIDLDGTCMRYGDGLFVNSQNVAYNIDSSGDYNVTETIFTIAVTIYVNREINGYIVYPSIMFGNIDLSDTYATEMTGMAMSGHISSNFVVSTTIGSHDTMTVDFTLKIEVIDNLTKIEFAEYDDDDQYIKSTIINSIEEIADFTTDPLTAYILVIETYEDSDGLSYNQRSLLTKEPYSTNSYFQPKFTWDDGFVHNETIIIEWS